MPTILVADRDQDTRLILATALRHVNLDVIEASDPDLAYASLCKTHVDAVVLNYPMPLGNGMTLTRAIRSNARIYYLPIINLTSHVLPEIEADAASDGVTRTLPKPAHILELIELLESLIGVRTRHAFR